MINDLVINKQIRKILFHNKISFLTSQRLYLKNDSKKYRVPDFYLPDQNIVVEYFSSWEVAENVVFQKNERTRFMKKVEVYGENKYNCLFIYPNEVGALEELILGFIKKIIEYNKFKNKQRPLMWVLPWMYEAKISPPRKEDFIGSESLKWVIPWLNEKAIEKPLEEDFTGRRKPLNWVIPWVNEEKIEKPLKSDFITEKIKVAIAPVAHHTDDEDLDKIIPIIGFFILIFILIMIILFIIAFFNA
jgi:hypothetical protein